ncbi:mechanosensitive ion channel family protein [Halpernia frigidisoli]|uniref:Mechanosensitive ion channel n=1 Tax=Halpernia frigidisoli TaxID=1125876 RepID=A0A1I3E382_9FLAO|nr:mechanosensitive ion channel family protein [Halpernia frigidisoli]SFH93492.1 Mechanosensitive ion channel [Halpernia frigidisoli]
MQKNALSFTQGLQESLVEYWNTFVLSLPGIFVGILILSAFFLIASYLSKLIKSRFLNKNHDPLFVTFLSKTIKFLLIIFGVILAMQAVGLSGIAKGLLAGAGISAFIFGFAFKDIAENFLGGMILAFNRPFSLDDTIMIREFSGHVKALNFRTTHIKTFDEKDVFIPNSVVIKEPLTNFTRDGQIRMDFIVGIDYEDDITKAIETIEKAIEPIEDLKKNKKPFAVVEELATSTVNIRVYFWTDTLDYKKGVLQIKSEVMTKVKEILVSEGFSLPSDIQELKIYGKQPLPINILNLNNDKN